MTTAEVLAAHLERRAQPCSPTSEAYDALAPGYDVLTREYDHERWLSALERLARQHGLAGRRLLDVACGTGQSFLPLRTRGYEVTACDSSAGMLARAERKAPEASLHQLDMRELPVLGSFDLITCIDDSLNYLLEETELEGALAGIARNLAPGGIAVWDLNTIAQYRGQFARDHVVSEEAVFIGWQSRGADRETGPGDLVEIAIDVFVGDDREGWWRSTGVHTQRHWRRAVVERLARNAGLRVLDVRGQHPGVVIDSELDELAHTKAIYLACAKKGEPMHVGRP